MEIEYPSLALIFYFANNLDLVTTDKTQNYVNSCVLNFFHETYYFRTDRNIARSADQTEKVNSPRSEISLHGRTDKNALSAPAAREVTAMHFSADVECTPRNDRISSFLRLQHCSIISAVTLTARNHYADITFDFELVGTTAVM